MLVEIGEETWGCPTILHGKLKDIPKGVVVRIECLGKVRTKSGFDAWNFAVYEDDGT
jgi:hypothetical protein